MNRRTRIFLSITVLVGLLFAFSLSAEAADTEEIKSDFADILPEGFEGVADEEPESYIGPGALLGEIFAAVSGEATRIGGFCLLLISGLCLLGAASLKGGVVGEASSVGVSVIVGVGIINYILPILAEVLNTLSGVSQFFGALVPIASAIQLASGSVSAAAVSAVGMNVTVSVISYFSEPFFLSLCGFGLALGLLSALGAPTNLSSSVKKTFMWCMGLVSALLMGLLTLQTFIASAKDSATMRAARYAASSLIPVVGGTVSGAMATLSTGLSYVKSVVGIGALVVLITMLLSPLVILLLYRCALSIITTLSDHLSLKKATALYTATLSGLDLFIAVYSISSVVYVFEISLFLSSGA